VSDLLLLDDQLQLLPLSLAAGVSTDLDGQHKYNEKEKE